MFLVSWFFKSITRQISVLLVLILSSVMLMVVVYFYNIQTEQTKNSTELMAEQLLSSLISSNAKSIHFNDYYNAWQNINNQLLNNKKQINKGGVFRINEIAILDKNNNVFSHSSPKLNPLKQKYTGVYPINLFDKNNTLHKVRKWYQRDGIDYLRLYQQISYEKRVVGTIILQLDLSILQQQQQALTKKFIYYFLFISIIVILVGAVFGRWVSQPILQIEKSLEKMGTGTLSLANLLKRRDEYQHLAQSIEKIDKSLFDSATKISLLLDSTAEAIYGIDTNGYCTFVNKAFLDMMGYELDSQVLGKNMHSLIHHSYSNGEVYPETNCQIFKAFLENKNTHVDNEVLWRKNGSSFSAEYWSHPIEQNGKCIGAVVTFLDITRRIEFSKKISESEKNLAITLNSIGDAVIATDPDGKVTRMNPAAEKLTGWLLKDAKGLSLKSVFSIIDVTTRQPIDNPVDKVLETGETIYLSNHTTLISKDGSEYQISDSAAPIKDGDRIIGMVLVFNDVSKEYKLREIASKSKRDLQAIMDHSPAVIYVKDLDSRFIFVNKQFALLFNLNQDDIVGNTAYDFFPKNIADEMRKNDLAVISAKHSCEFEEAATLQDGLHTYVSVKFPLYDDNGEIYAICGISTDISERKNQEEQLRRSQKMDALGKLTGGIAHDYNNMLGIILGYAEQIVENVKDSEKVLRYSSNIQHAANRGTKLTRQLLSFTKGKQPISDNINISDLLNEQKNMLEKIITAKHQLILKLDDNLWSVSLDSSDLEDAIINICINSFHAMDSNGSLTISVENIHLDSIDVGHMGLSEGDYIMLSLTDTGSGMNEETKVKAFDPFYSTKGENGTGLGLSQVYGFVKRSGGMIKIYSELGEGTRIVMFFPRSVQETVTTDVAIVSPSSNFMGNETLLVVDDEVSLVELAYDIFTSHGYNVLTANDGVEALSVLKNEKVDLIVSDVIMPNMDGYQLADKVKKLYPEIKLQMVSGFSDERHKNNIQEDLNTSMLHKPYHSKVILQRVRSLLDNKSNDKPRNYNVEDEQTSSMLNVLIMDDDVDTQELYKIKLRKLNCNVIAAYNAEEAINIFRHSLSSETPIELLILDLSIPGGIGGVQVASEIRKLSSNVKLIVASGHSESKEMINPTSYNFDAAIEKNIDKTQMQSVIEKVLGRKI